jgi:hypothetical protein
MPCPRRRLHRQPRALPTRTMLCHSTRKEEVEERRGEHALGPTQHRDSCWRVWPGLATVSLTSHSFIMKMLIWITIECLSAMLPRYFQVTTYPVPDTYRILILHGYSTDTPRICIHHVSVYWAVLGLETQLWIRIRCRISPSTQFCTCPS